MTTRRTSVRPHTSARKEEASGLNELGAISHEQYEVERQVHEALREQAEPVTRFGPSAPDPYPKARIKLNADVLEQLQEAVTKGDPGWIPIDATCRCGEGMLNASTMHHGTAMGDRESAMLMQGCGTTKGPGGGGLSPEAIADLMNPDIAVRNGFKVILICSANDNHRFVTDYVVMD